MNNTVTLWLLKVLNSDKNVAIEHVTFGSLLVFIVANDRKKMIDTVKQSYDT